MTSRLTMLAVRGLDDPGRLAVGEATVTASDDGAVLATFDDPRAALRALDAAGGTPAAGLHAGPIEEAALARRLADAAHVGQRLLSDSAHALLADDGACRDLGRHRLPGVLEPVRIHAVGDTSPPRTLGCGSALELRERDEELQALGSSVRALVEEGRGGVVLVEGPPGIGKSALVQAALELQEAGEATLLRARGTELEGGLSFGAVRELLTPAFLSLAREDRDALLQGPAALARPVLGFPAADGVEGDPLHGLFWLLAGLAGSRPVLLAVDDFHWLDEESARFLAFLARRLEGLPILLLAAERPKEPGVDPAWGDALRAAATTILRPGPLSADAAGRLVPTRPAQDVRRVTGGNPLLLVELARVDPRVPLEEAAPSDLAAQVSARVARVSEQAVELSRAVAISATPMALGDLAALAGIEPAGAAEAADALIRVQVLRPARDGLEFLHPLMRAAVYEGLDPFFRRRAHRRAAELLAARGADLDAVAAHLLAGEPAGDPEVVRMLCDAAERARSRVAPRAAARYLERALAEPPPPGQGRVNLRFELGRLQASLGQPDAAATLRAALDEATIPEQRADIAIELAEALTADERHREAMSVLERLLETVELDRDRELKVRATLWDAGAEAGIDPRALAQHLDRIPPDLPGDTAAQREALVIRAYAMLLSRAPVGRVVDVLERTVGDRAAPHALPVPGEIRRWRLLSLCGNLELAEALALDATERARETGAEALFVAAQYQVAISANQRGDLRGAEAALRLGLAQEGLEPFFRSQLEDWLVTTLSMQGRFDEAEELLETLAAREPVGLLTTLLDHRRGEIALDRGDHAAALVPLERMYATGVPERLLSGAVSTVCDYAVALGAVGRTEEAVRIARAALDRVVGAGAHVQILACALLALGRVLPGREGVGHLERAVALLEPSPYRWNLAQAQVAYGAALRRANQRARAREQLEAALEYAATNGAAPIEALARDELRLCGARPRRVMRSGVDALTPSEERIARMAAAGLSNKDIAQKLFVTVKNVEMHLVGAYRKLDVKSRRELPDVFAAHRG